MHRASFALPQFVKKVSVEIGICEIALVAGSSMNRQEKTIFAEISESFLLALSLIVPLIILLLLLFNVAIVVCEMHQLEIKIEEFKKKLSGFGHP